MNNLISFDQTITTILSNIFPHNNFFSLIFSFFSLSGNSLFIWVAIILLVVIIEELFHPGIQKRDVKFVVYFLLCFTITGIVVNYGIKNLVQRPRPVQTTLSLTCPKDFSFPSSHAATAFASAVTLGFFDKKRRWFYYLVAILISYSRIFLHCHYFFDVLFGAISGYLISKVILQSTKNLSLKK